MNGDADLKTLRRGTINSSFSELFISLVADYCWLIKAVNTAGADGEDRSFRH